MKLSVVVVAVVWFSWISPAFSIIEECPMGWHEFDLSCYNFVFYPTRNFQQAKTACEVDGGSLLSVGSTAEDNFISDWLTQHEQNKANQWWTSGSGEGQNMLWGGDNSVIRYMPSSWLDEKYITTQFGEYIVYTYDSVSGRFKWARQDGSAELPYICEVAMSEAYRILQQARDHLYGTDIIDPNDIPLGPKFITQPESVVVVGYLNTASIECEVHSNPSSTYTWYRKVLPNDPMTELASNDRYTLSNGQLHITDPKEVEDFGVYQCLAKNELGAVLSDPARIEFGFLQEFSNDPRGPVTAFLYHGTVLTCKVPAHHPAVLIHWYKAGGGPNFLRTDLHPQLFVSNNGRLYISETTPTDAGTYHCMVTLTSRVGQTLSTVQPPIRTSMGIQLILRGETPGNYAPYIHDDFPLVTPNPPKRGEMLTLECFAYGKLPLHYSWTYNGGPVPAKSYFKEHNRMLVLPDSNFEDSGNYTCKVMRGTGSSHTKTFHLVVEGRPHFIFPLRDQHIDVGSRLTWRCEALGRPAPTYTWYKDGVKLSPVEGDIEIAGNILTVLVADLERHPGMYQCEATNSYGIRYSSGQLRVIAVAPSFAKHPMPPMQYGTLGGDITLVCEPEASPAPTYTWSKDNTVYPVNKDPANRVHMLDNGNLVIQGIQLSDQGTYKCTATNNLGEATTETMLTVLEKPVITIVPTDTEVDVNGTVFLPCQASYDSRHRDLIYRWSLNGFMLNIERDHNYRQAVRSNVHGLYIINSQLKHTGRYTCWATTVDFDSKFDAYVQVRGPPGECAGLHGTVFGKNVTLKWTSAPPNGAPVQGFRVLFKTNFNQEWRTLVDDLPIAEVTDAPVIDRVATHRCQTILTGLKPGNLYNLKIVAWNMYGYGPPSQESASFHIPHAPPEMAVPEIREGTSTVGTLPLEWDGLSEEDLTGDGVGYTIYYRKKDRKMGLWIKEQALGHVNRHVPFIGAENYFLPYEVMIAPFNALGQGPNSSVFTIMSAEDIPIGTPVGVYADSINGTAILVYWTPIPNIRQFIRGRPLGYQVNYWSQTARDPEMGATPVWCDNNCAEGLVWALDPNEDYWLNVQVFTKAGLGPMSELGEGSTFTLPPKLYPEFVHVGSYKGFSVLVTWKGVSTGLEEEPIIGYKLRWWPATEDIRSAQDTVIPDKRTWGIIKGVQPGIVYALRVLGYSNGGDGNKSPTQYFTLEGQVIYNTETTEVMNGTPQLLSNNFLTSLLCFVYLFHYVLFHHDLSNL